MAFFDERNQADNMIVCSAWLKVNSPFEKCFPLIHCT